jgi:hypothetical protein
MLQDRSNFIKRFLAEVNRMKTYRMIIGSGMVLAVALACFVSYRIFMPDTTGRPQTISKSQKQNFRRSITDKELVRPASKTPTLPITDKMVNPVSPFPEWMQAGEHTA